METLAHTFTVRNVSHDNTTEIDSFPTLASAIRCILEAGFEGDRVENAVPFMIFDGERFEASVWCAFQDDDHAGVYRVAYRDGRVQSFNVDYVTDSNGGYDYTNINLVD